MTHEDCMMPLFEAAQKMEFAAFDQLFESLRAQLAPQLFAEAYLMRAQIKLFTSDATLQQDIQRAQQDGAVPQFPFLCDRWKQDALNRFLVFPAKQGALHRFLQALPVAAQAFLQYYGQAGICTVRQLQSEVQYFLGNEKTALALSIQQPKSVHCPVSAMQAIILQFRCHLALGRIQNAQACMFETIRYSKCYPECVGNYAAFREWANVTTGWSGDSPRFVKSNQGEKLPDLSDRLTSIKFGIGRDTPCEIPFVQHARQTLGNAYSLRSYYMHCFNAVYWHSTADYERMQHHLDIVCDALQTNGLVMPLVEMGEQILPLLRYVQQKAGAAVPDWLCSLRQRAAQYERHLAQYQLSYE